jgi:hypothetical protein
MNNMMDIKDLPLNAGLNKYKGMVPFMYNYIRLMTNLILKSLTHKYSFHTMEMTGLYSMV